MKWSKTEILRSADKALVLDEEIAFSPATFDGNDRLRKLEKVHVTASGLWDGNQNVLRVHLDVSGVMVVPCAITDEDVLVEFKTEDDPVFSFGKTDDEEAIEVKGDTVELMPVVYPLIMMEIPLKVVKPGLKDYPKGDGWEVLTEEEYLREKQSQIDPRLAKLRDYKPKDE
ncbi:MAG: hypothetical protein A2Y20_01350 [Firmicutes bacterium GWF2_51_9]|nr:MAG: hypothetical protein A2Y20_01350 [Firmicutes bacterium GWF2_51_9]OGS58059.1 MAG: hypothetical protein A2Y19_05850 [Firmicutes bacterium GWE2_51_13]HAM62589.1 hypothetical protein [Erysipelotrichaceae bacterium]HAO60630.1 hypothetical protein [Erysipelotrichaceae bacterium]HBZ41300.1 hypothetical protein [Erysipelotrichaceae bacterium]